MTWTVTTTVGARNNPPLAAAAAYAQSGPACVDPHPSFLPSAVAREHRRDPRTRDRHPLGWRCAHAIVDLVIVIGCAGRDDGRGGAGVGKIKSNLGEGGEVDHEEDGAESNHDLNATSDEATDTSTMAMTGQYWAPAAPALSPLERTLLYPSIYTQATTPMPHKGACLGAQTTIALVFAEVCCSSSSATPPPTPPPLLLLPPPHHTPPWLHILPTDISRRRRTSRLTIAGPVGEYSVSAACIAILGALSPPPFFSPSLRWRAQSAAPLPTFGDAEAIHSDTSNFPEFAKISIWTSARSEGTAEE
ncbi:hypothetical protein B0H13DRAFT_2673766 [Mycena leptocephala]|nr:hypothetical protein B0H13DRAFT_2673766 [Mycena leptocephala]